MFRLSSTRQHGHLATNCYIFSSEHFADSDDDADFTKRHKKVRFSFATYPPSSIHALTWRSPTNGWLSDDDESIFLKDEEPVDLSVPVRSRQDIPQ